jgi:DNA recombination protein RmuC
MGLLAIGLGAFVLGLSLLLLRERRSSDIRQIGGSLDQVRGELARLGRTQEDLRHDVQRSREASMSQLAQAVDGIRGELGRAQVSLAEVKSLEEGRARQMDQAATSLKRLEAVVAGSQARGAAGENILARSLSQLPPDLLEVNVSFGAKIVEYALRLPGGKLLPIDSKWTSAASLERLSSTEDPQEQKRLSEQVGRDIRSRIREMVKYLDPERTLSMALLAVPDAVYTAAPEAHGEGYREGVLVVPYSLALPYVLSIYRLALRFGSALDADQLASRLHSLEDLLRRIEEDVEGRLSRGLVQIANARDAIRENLADARRASARVLEAAEGEGEERSGISEVLSPVKVGR